VTPRPRALALPTLLLLGCALAAGCRSAPKDTGPTTVTRTRVSRITGTATDTPAQDVEAQLPGQPCKHVWRIVDRETHMFVDASGEIPFTTLCTPIRCEKCGVTRHECVRRPRR
jgi:hypothetical protein